MHGLHGLRPVLKFLSMKLRLHFSWAFSMLALCRRESQISCWQRELFIRRINTISLNLFSVHERHAKHENLVRAPILSKDKAIVTWSFIFHPCIHVSITSFWPRWKCLANEHNGMQNTKTSSLTFSSLRVPPMEEQSFQLWFYIFQKADSLWRHETQPS